MVFYKKNKKTLKSFEDGRAEEGNRSGRARETENVSISLRLEIK